MARKAPSKALKGKPVFIGYARISVGTDDEESLSLDYQEHKLRQWAALQEYELSEVIRETVSGSVAHAKRPGLSRALAAIRTGKADGLAVLKLDRLGRSVMDTLTFMDEVRRKDYRFVSISESLDTSTATGQLTLTIIAAMAEWERKVISERTSAALRQRAAAGKHTSNKLPYGYRLEGDTMTTTVRGGETRLLVPYPPEKAVLDALEALQSKGMGAWRIASTMNKRGELNPRTGGQWKAGTVAAILATAARRRG